MEVIEKFNRIYHLLFAKLTVVLKPPVKRNNVPIMIYDKMNTLTAKTKQSEWLTLYNGKGNLQHFLL